MKTSKSGVANEGFVVKKWSEEKELERIQLQKKLLSQGVDAKWTGGKTNSKQETISFQASRRSVRSLRSELEKVLSFPTKV